MIKLASGQVNVLITSGSRGFPNGFCVYAMGLAALRRAADLTQTELARSLGVSQAAIAKTEQRHDLLLSTLNTYLAAIGGHMRIIVSFDGGGEVELDLRHLDPATAKSE